MNRTTTFLFLLLIFPCSFSWGQHKLAFAPTVSPTASHINYRYRYFYPESDGQVVEPVYVNGIRWATGFSAGVSVLYTYAPGWTVSSGIWYHQLSIRQARQPIAGEGTVTLRSRAIRFPLLLHYALSSQRLTPYFTLGFLVDAPITARVVVARGAEPTQYLRLTGSGNPIFHGMLGAGLQYKLTERYRLMVQPIWTYTFGQFGGASTHNNSFELSVQTQVAYRF